jgi:hypothetical protein
MSDEIKEFSREEASSFLFGGSPAQSSMAPAQQAPSAPVAPPGLAMPSKGRAPVGIPDPTQLVETVSKANKKLKEETPPPEPPSAISGLVDQITSNWKPIAVTAAATYAATKAAPVIGNAIGSAYNKMKTRNVGAPVETTRVDPIFATPDEMRQAEVLTQKPAPTMTPLENLSKRAEDLRAAVQGKAPAGAAGAGVPPVDLNQPVATPMSAAPVDAPAPLPSATPSSDATKNVAETINGLMNETSNKPALKTQSSGVNQYLNMFGYQKTNPTSERSLAAIDATNKLVDQAFQGVAPKGASGNPEGYRNQYIPFIEQNANTLAPVTQQQLNKSRTKGQVDTVNKLVASGVPLSQIGKATPGAMAAAVIPALAVAGIEGYRGNKEAVNRELKDAWDSLKSVVTWPYDVSKAATKGDFGPLKDMLMSVNPATLMLNEANKNDNKAIQKMIEDERYAAQVGGGRGIAPPSAYMR